MLVLIHKLVKSLHPHSLARNRILPPILFWLCLSSLASAANHVLLIEGLGKDPKYSKQFMDALAAVRQGLIFQGYEASRVRLLAEQKSEFVNAIANRESIEGELKRLASEMKTSDTLLLVMVGHGQSDFVEPKFNLPGPDLAVQELSDLLDALPARDQRLILGFPCSGHFSEFLAAPSRLILAAGDGPRQIYHTVMPQYLAPAMAEKKADINADGKITAYEIYQFLTQQVDDYYKSRELIQTENPSLEDNGDGEPTTAAEGMDAGDGELAKRLVILPAPPNQASQQVVLEKRQQ